jgi:putative glutamine amidotransferase
MPRPVIGVCAAIEQARWGSWDEVATLLPRSYSEAVQRAGGLPVLLAPDPVSADSPDEVLDRLDAVILAGGADIDPGFYGAAAHPEIKRVWPERDRFELALARRALEGEMPVLGICRGMQVVNVARGGTLHQYVPDVSDGSVAHRRGLRAVAWAHDGIVEAIEGYGEALYLGVQWHVETLVHFPRHLRVFEALVDPASGHRERRAA